MKSIAGLIAERQAAVFPSKYGTKVSPNTTAIVAVTVDENDLPSHSGAASPTFFLYGLVPTLSAMPVTLLDIFGFALKMRYDHAQSQMNITSPISASDQDQVVQDAQELVEKVFVAKNESIISAGAFWAILIILALLLIICFFPCSIVYSIQTQIAHILAAILGLVRN